MEGFWNINRSAIPAPKICFLSLFLLSSLLVFLLHAMTIPVPTSEELSANKDLPSIILHRHELSLPSPVYTKYMHRHQREMAHQTCFMRDIREIVTGPQHGMVDENNPSK
ncbi:hypothetical protein F5Y03DRAFT_342861 [Xylaria venustula]|nr:hypothetical protein F5Y03DRAFT_342861 [Xylaria venustula]